MSEHTELAYLRELIARYRSSHRQSLTERRCFCNLCDLADDLAIVPLSEHDEMETPRSVLADTVTPEEEATYKSWDTAWWHWHRTEEMAR